MIKSRVLFMIMILWLACSRVQAQTHVLFEAGVTYFSNDIEKQDTRLYDFFAFTFNTRIILSPGSYSAFSLDIPVSFRSRFKQDIVTRAGIHLPFYVTYNIGSGASDKPSDKKLGALVGVGYGYFYQRSLSEQNETPSYKESLSFGGPGLQMGLRFPLKKISLFKVGEKDVHPSLTIRTSYQLNIKNTRNSIGSLSVLAGFAF